MRLPWENSVKSEDFNKLEIGDTILIKYSNDDNSVAEIIHCYWNDEFRKLVKKQN
jgi:sulfite reductase alpha subunit-like flavoprotein